MKGILVCVPVLPVSPFGRDGGWGVLSVPSTGRSGSSACLGEQQDPPPSSLGNSGTHPDCNKSVPSSLLRGLRSGWWGLKHLTLSALLPVLLSPGPCEARGWAKVCWSSADSPGPAQLERES